MPAKACLCTICSCGKHKCPHNPRGIPRGNQPCVFSEYKDEYKPHDTYAKLKDCRPDQQPIRSDLPMDGLTTHKVDYIEHPLGQHYKHKADEYRQPEGNMENLTNYNLQYTRKELSPVKPIRREEEKRIAAKFEGEPTYKGDYRRWDVQPYTKYGSDYVYRPSDAPFDSNTNYHSDYIPHRNVARQEMLRPSHNPAQSDQPFDDTTDYKTSYIRHELPTREVKEKEVWQPNGARLDDLTNYRRDYVPRDLQKTESCRPLQRALDSDAKFADLTTHRDDYRPLQLERPYVHEREVYRKPEGGMDDMTTHRFDFTPKQVDRAAAIRPAEAKRVSASFDSTTQYKTDYKAYGPGERAQMINREHYSPNEARFEGEPTYRRDYISYPGTLMTKSLKPVDPGYSTGVPLEDGTEYKKEFGFKVLPPCPSDAIMAGRTDTGYTFKEQDELGHKWYEIATRA